MNSKLNNDALGWKDCGGANALSGRGNVFATVHIVLRKKSDAGLDALIKKWKADKPYDPRKDM